ncbi:MAG: hypothetical protein KGI54_17035, partial [Pseudomonadota bacterium]|nr:hypothetical protein [Pseudomonadota bacterium]
LDNPFTPEIDEELVYFRDEGLSWMTLQSKFNISSKLLKQRYKFIIDRDIAAEKARYAGETTCLKCRNKFWSEHRVNLRYCDPCRNKNKELANNMVEAVTFGKR